MNATFARLYRQLGWATVAVLVAALGALGITLLCALLGFVHAVASFRGVAASLACVFVALLILFLLTSVVGAVVRWIERRDQLRGS